MTVFNGPPMGDPRVTLQASYRGWLSQQNRHLRDGISCLRLELPRNDPRWKNIPFRLELRTAEGEVITANTMPTATGYYDVWSPRTTLRSALQGAKRAFNNIPCPPPKRRQRLRQRIGMVRHSFTSAGGRFTDGLRGRVRLVATQPRGYIIVNIYTNSMTINVYGLPEEDPAEA